MEEVEDSRAAAARERALAGLPVTARRLQVGDTSTTLLEGGDGPPLVLLHGGIECGGAIWAPVISALAQSHRLVVPDAPGLGESEPVEKLDSAAFADWLSELIGGTCDQKPVLVAHSLVANYAARFAAERGECLRRLVIYAAPGIGPYRMPLGLRVVAVRFALRPTARNHERFESFALRDRESTRDRDPEWFDAFSAYGLERARVTHVKRTMNQLVKHGTQRIPDADLERITVPVGVVWGRSDRMTPLRVAGATVTRLGWPIRVVDDAAHVPHIEQPDRFLASLEDVT